MGGGLAHASPLWPLRARGGGAPRKDTRTRVLILMSDTGGGHRASAEALRAGFQQLYGDRYRIDVVSRRRPRMRGSVH
jgi:1,2-diacylglycerol 3-beta-galactosyltransferase